MKEIYLNILEKIKSIPMIDSHEHLTPGMEIRDTVDLLSEYAGQYLGNDLISAGMPGEQFEKIMDVTIPAKERFVILKPWLSLVNATGYGYCMKEALECCTGADRLTENTIAETEKRFKDFFQNRELSSVLKEQGIACSIVDWMPLEWKFDKDFYIQAYNPLFLIIPESEKRVKELENFSGIRIRSFHDYLDACRQTIRKKVLEQGVKIVKISIAYHRSLSFPVTLYTEAEAEYNQCMDRIIHYRGGLSFGLGFDHCHRFQNYMIHLILQEAEKWNLTVQFHTGYLAGNAGITSDGNPMSLSPLFQQYPDVRFDLFHISYPYCLEAGTLAKMYPNVYVNCCWAHILSPNATKKALVEWIQILPANKIIGFGGDADSPFSILGHARIAKQNVAVALEQLVDQGAISEEQVEYIAKRILYQNPKELYKI